MQNGKKREPNVYWYNTINRSEEFFNVCFYEIDYLYL